eukprot:scaffold66306_cov39-Phaeocystis_antarctica.AAC.1
MPHAHRQVRCRQAPNSHRPAAAADQRAQRHGSHNPNGVAPPPGTYGCRLSCMGLQAPSHTVAGAITYGCRRHPMGLQGAGAAHQHCKLVNFHRAALVAVILGQLRSRLARRDLAQQQSHGGAGRAPRVAATIT